MFRLALVLGLALGSLQLHAENKAKSDSSSAPKTQTCALIDPVHENTMGNDWDRQQANIDLMNQEMRAGKYDSKSTKVAILDTACTGDKRVSDRIKGRVLIAEIPKQLTQPDHCTMVASRVTMASPGTEMKNWPLLENQFTADTELRRAATSACRDGYEVINLSAINRGGPLLAVSQDTRAALASQGCILVQASGNDQNNPDPAVKERLKTDIKAKDIRELDILTVGANSINGKPGGFSVPGVLRAPGIDVPAVNNKGDLELATGTSFAAPTVSGIVKNVLTILKNSPRTKNMHKLDRAHLAIKIVKASANGQNVDGYRAVVLAKAAGNTGESVVKDSYSVLDVFNAEAAKIKTHGPCKSLSCEGTGEKNERQTCYNDKRRLLSLTPDNPLQSDIEDLMDTAGATSAQLAKQWSDARAKLLGGVRGNSR